MSEADPDLRTSFFQCEARTGRMSSRRPNMQNLPKEAGKEIRSPIVPRPGHAFVSCDFDSIEGRLIAYYLGDPGYRDLYRKGLDPHAWMASKIHAEPAEVFDKTGPRANDRDKAKKTFYAISYGAGAPRVSDQLNISRAEAKSIISSVKAALPGYKKLMKRLRRKVRVVGYVETVLGRRQYVPKDKEYVALNAIVQGSAADIMKLAVVAARAAIADLGELVLFVHDENLAECKIEHAEEVARRMAAAMEGCFDLDPPLKVETSIVTTNYAEA